MAIENGTVCAMNCTFDGGCCGVTAINMYPTATVNVFNCTFTGFGHEHHSDYGLGEGPCLQIESEYDDAAEMEDIYLDLKCIANIFVNNLGYPIALRYFGEDDPHIILPAIQFSQYVLQKNFLQGYNGRYVSKQLEHANMIYHNQQPYKR
eukprot:364479_1